MHGQSTRIEAEEKARTYAKAKAETEKKLHAQTQASVEAEKKLKAEIQAKQSAEKKAAVEAQERAKAEMRAQDQTKAKSQAQAKARAESAARAKVQAQADAQAKAQAKARAESAARAKAEQKERAKLAKKTRAYGELLTRSDAEDKAGSESEKRYKSESKYTKATKAIKQIPQYVFQSTAIPRKFAFISVLVIIAAIAFTLRLVGDPPLVIGNATTIIEDKPAVTIDNLVNNSNIGNDTSKLNPPLPKIAKLTVMEGYNQINSSILLAEDKSNLVQFSDDRRLAISYGSYISYDFSNVSIPVDAVIKSVVIYVEHFEEERFTSGKLKWSIGTGWPTKPVIWAELNAPLHEEESHEAFDSWDITSLVDTPEKINSLQLRVKNNDNFSSGKTLIDYIHVVVDWD